MLACVLTTDFYLDTLPDRSVTHLYKLNCHLRTTITFDCMRDRETKLSYSHLSLASLRVYLALD